MKKIFITFCFLFLTNPAFAQENLDSDLKLSLEELRKKYPSPTADFFNGKEIDVKKIDVPALKEKEVKSILLNDKFTGANAAIYQKIVFFRNRILIFYSNIKSPTKEQAKIKNFIFSDKILLGLQSPVSCNMLKNNIPTDTPSYEKFAVKNLLGMSGENTGVKGFNINLKTCIPTEKQQLVASFFNKIFSSSGPAMTEDSDSTLSISELRKKYNISWIDKKYGKADACYDVGDCENCNYPNVKVCRFSLEKTKDGRDLLIANLDGFNDEEIKSVFVNYRNYADEPRAISLFELTLKYLYQKKNNLTEREEKLKKFIYSPKILGSYNDAISCEVLKNYIPTTLSYYNRLSLVVMSHHLFEPQNLERYLKECAAETKVEEIRQILKKELSANFTN